MTEIAGRDGRPDAHAHAQFDLESNDRNASDNDGLVFVRLSTPYATAMMPNVAIDSGI